MVWVGSVFDGRSCTFIRERSPGPNILIAKRQTTAEMTIIIRKVGLLIFGPSLWLLWVCEVKENRKGCGEHHQLYAADHCDGAAIGTEPTDYPENEVYHAGCPCFFHPLRRRFGKTA
jgi:hypothetical protein